MIIDEKKLEEWRVIYNATSTAPESHIVVDIFDVLETFDHLWAISHAAEDVVIQKYFGRGSVGAQRMWQLRGALTDLSRKLQDQLPDAQAQVGGPP